MPPPATLAPFRRPASPLAAFRLLEGDDAHAMVKLINHLEDHDDVQNVYANYDIDDALFEQLSA